MGLDLYAGPLWRLYAGDLERPTQRLARETGLKVEIVYAPGAEPQSRTHAARAVDRLKRAIDAEAGICLASDVNMTDWSEDSPVYFSEQLRREGLSSILLMAAYNHRPDLTRPLKLEASIEDDAVYANAYKSGYYMGPLAVLESHMFLPSGKNFLLLVDDPRGGSLAITSTSISLPGLIDCVSRSGAALWTWTPGLHMVSFPGAAMRCTSLSLAQSSNASTRRLSMTRSGMTLSMPSQCSPKRLTSPSSTKFPSGMMGRRRAPVCSGMWGLGLR